jgi:adenylate cyclase
MNGSIRTVSFKDVYEGTVPAQQFEGAVVIIGASAQSLSYDSFFTPMSKSMKINGVYVHANFLQSLLDGGWFTLLSKPTGWALLFFIAFLSGYLLHQFTIRRATLIFLALTGLYLIVYVIVFLEYKLLLPLIYPLAVLVASYILSIVGKYLNEEKERRRVTDLFGRYVSQSVVKQLLAAPDPVSIRGIRCEITILFVDLRGFTPLCEKLEPEQILELLNEYLDLCTDIVFQYGGTLDKFIGDGVMAIFGAPIPADNHAEMAVRAALHMKNESQRLSTNMREKTGHFLFFGMGIHTGLAVIGNIGSNKRLDYTAIGDTVNLAARLEASAKPNQLLISGAVSEKIHHFAELESIGEIKLKGKANEVEVFEVIRLKPTNG